jgi:hypothetical protein
MIERVVRVGVNNNFNCTEEEYAQLDEIAKTKATTVFFTNSNIKTPKIESMNKHTYKGVITLNPDIRISNALVKRLYDIDSKKVAFVRVKYIPEDINIVRILKEVSRDYPVVITNMRFNGKASMMKFVPKYDDHYQYSCSRYRLYGNSFSMVEALTEGKRIHLCDRKGVGCEGCGLCSKLVTGKILPIYTLNLSSSGLCPFSCVDCYSKTMQHFLEGIHSTIIKYDSIHRNSKQSGRTVHIKEHIRNHKTIKKEQDYD